MLLTKPKKGQLQLCCLPRAFTLWDGSPFQDLTKRSPQFLDLKQFEGPSSSYDSPSSVTIDVLALVFSHFELCISNAPLPSKLTLRLVKVLFASSFFWCSLPFHLNQSIRRTRRHCTFHRPRPLLIFILPFGQILDHSNIIGHPPHYWNEWIGGKAGMKVETEKVRGRGKQAPPFGL